MAEYIRLVDGLPHKNPITEDNFKRNFPGVDVNTSIDFAIFERTPQPELGVYQEFEDPQTTYEMVGGICKLIWHVRDFTNEEKLAKQNALKSAWEMSGEKEKYPNWVFDEEKCYFVPPVPYPEGAGQNEYFWQESSSTWIAFPPYPTDGAMYRLNVETVQWEPLEV